MTTPEEGEISTTWEQAIKPAVAAYVENPIDTKDFFNTLTSDLVQGVKPAITIAQRVIEEADWIRQFARSDFPLFPYNLIFKCLPMAAVNLRWTEEFGKGKQKEVMEMIRENAREDGRELSAKEEAEIFDDLSSQASLLNQDPTGKLFIDDFESGIPELGSMEYFNYPRSVRKDLISLGVARFRKYLEVLQGIPLL